VGGLIGTHQGNTVNRCYATGDVRGIETDAFSYSADVGGLIGTKELFDNEVIDCYASGNVTSNSNGYSFGGLVGANRKGDIRRCYAVGSVACTRYGGGLAGSFSGGSMNSCFATGTVVTEEYDAGGLIGYNGGIITDCYAWASVKGDEFVGGLIGENDEASLNRCYAIGKVEGDKNVGGLIGANVISGVNRSFWDTNTTEQETSAAGSERILPLCKA